MGTFRVCWHSERSGSDQLNGSSEMWRTMRKIGERSEHRSDGICDENCWERNEGRNGDWRNGNRRYDPRLLDQLASRAALIRSLLIGAAVRRLLTAGHPVLRRRLPTDAIKRREVGGEHHRNRHKRGKASDHRLLSSVRPQRLSTGQVRKGLSSVLELGPAGGQLAVAMEGTSRATSALGIGDAYSSAR